MSQPKYTILIPAFIESPDVEIEVLGDDYHLIAAQATEASQIEDAAWAACDAILVFHAVPWYTEEFIAKLDNCKIIVRAGVGYDNLDLKAAGAAGIICCNVPDYGTNEVADHAIGLMLSMIRKIPVLNEKIRVGGWHYDLAGPLPRLWNRNFSIIGLGRIGTATAIRAKAFGLNVCFYDPFLPDGVDKALGITRYYNLDDMLAAADIVSFHPPLTDETAGMADGEFFAKMKPNGFLINTARGGVIDIPALAEALRSGRLRGAALDLWPMEPPPDDDPLITAFRAGEPWVADRLVLTPHSAFLSEEGMRELRVNGALEVQRALMGQAPRNCVNIDALVNPRAGARLLATLRKTADRPT